MSSAASRLRGQGGIELPRDPHDLIRLCKDQGWQVDYTTSSRIRLTSPLGKRVIMGKLQGDHRALANTRALLKRAGLKPARVTDLGERREQRTRPPLVARPLSVPLEALNAQHALETSSTQDSAAAPAAPSKDLLMSAHPAERNAVASLPLKRGERRQLILDAVRRAELGAGVHPSTIVDRCRAHASNLSKERIQIAMAGYAKSGWLERRAGGRYSLTAEGELVLTGEKTSSASTRRAEHSHPLPAFPDVQLPSGAVTTADLAALDEALSALARVEQIIRRHRDIALRCEQLKAVLCAVTQVEESTAAKPTTSAPGPGTSDGQPAIASAGA